MNTSVHWLTLWNIPSDISQDYSNTVLDTHGTEHPVLIHAYGFRALHREIRRFLFAVAGEHDAEEREMSHPCGTGRTGAGLRMPLIADLLTGTWWSTGCASTAQKYNLDSSVFSYFGISIFSKLLSQSDYVLGIKSFIQLFAVFEDYKSQQLLVLI